MEIVCRKCTPRASPIPFFNFGKQPKTTKKKFLNKLLKIKYFERGLAKAFLIKVLSELFPKLHLPI